MVIYVLIRLLLSFLLEHRPSSSVFCFSRYYSCQSVIFTSLKEENIEMYGLYGVVVIQSLDTDSWPLRSKVQTLFKTTSIGAVVFGDGEN